MSTSPIQRDNDSAVDAEPPVRRSVALQPHIPQLDGVRGVAILLVILSHATLIGGAATESGVDGLFVRIAGAGWAGVDLFFVLSGFLITGILYDSVGGRRYFYNFYMRRFLRIFPLYYGFLFVLFFVAPRFLTMPETFEQLKTEQLWYWTYLSNVKIVLDGLPRYDVAHFWSLAVEEQFYLLWPLVILAFRRRTLLAICLGCVAGALLVRLYFAFAFHPMAAYVVTPGRADSLAVGAFLALAARGPSGLSKFERWKWPLVVVSGCALAVTFALKSGAAGIYLRYTLLISLLAAFFGGGLLVALTNSDESLIARVLASRVLRFFGRYSYALYVLHVFAGRMVAEHLFDVESIPPVLGSRIPGYLLFFGANALVGVVLALISWHLWEVHFLKLKRFFAYERPKAAVRSR